MAPLTRRRWIRFVAMAVLAAIPAGIWWAGSGVEDAPEVVERPRVRRAVPAVAPDATGAELSGQIVGPEGRPIAGALVVLVQGDRPGVTGLRSYKTGATGGFRFERLSAGSYVVHARAGGFTAGATRPIELEAGDLEDVQVRLWSGGAILRGRVLDAGGGVIAGARVRASSYARGADETHEGRVFQTESDAEGRYQLMLPPGDHQLRAEADGYASVQESRAVMVDVTRDFTLRPAARIAGRVVTADGRQPVAGARVVARARRHDLSPPTATSDEQGRFLLAPLPPGRYTLTARKTGLLGVAAQPVVVGETEAADEVEVPMTATISLRGQVTSAARSPIAAVRVLLTALDRPEDPFGPPPVGLTDEEGRFLIEEMFPGRYRLSAGTEGYGQLVEPVSLARSTVRDLVLRDPVVVTGQVLKRDGQPVGRTMVRALLDPSDPGRKRTEMAGTDPEGRFSFRRLGAGELTLTVSLGSDAAATGPMRIGHGDRRDVTLRLEPGASVAGVARWDDGTPLAAETVISALSFCEGQPVIVRTGAEGNFRIGGLPPGEVGLQVIEPPGELFAGARPLTKLTLQRGEQRTGFELVVARR